MGPLVRRGDETLLGGGTVKRPPRIADDDLVDTAAPRVVRNVARRLGFGGIA